MVIKSILENFAAKQQNDFERMAIFSDSIMHEKIKEMRDALDKFSVSGEYSEYLLVDRNFNDVTKYMNARDSYLVHNPNRNY